MQQSLYAHPHPMAQNLMAPPIYDSKQPNPITSPVSANWEVGMMDMGDRSNTSPNLQWSLIG